MKRNFYLGKSLNLSRESHKIQAESKPIYKRKTKTFTYQKEKKNNTIDKQIRLIQTNKQTKISVHNVFQAKTGLQPTNKLTPLSTKQINTLYTNARPSHKGRGKRAGEGEVQDPFFTYSMP